MTAAIVWYLLRQTKLSDFREAIDEFEFAWIGLSIFLSIISHFLRAWRWKLMLSGSGHRIDLVNGYLAVMIGYLANSVFPRLGEVTRCGIVNRTDNVPVAKALGTVVTERAIDLIILLIISAFTFLLQFELLEEFFKDAVINLQNSLLNNWWILFGLLIVSVGGFYIVFYSSLSKKIAFFSKLKVFLRELWQGIISLKNLENYSGFWLATIGIWVLYFLMLYVITFGSPLTQNLGILAGFSILVMGSFGMASPIPNGIGVFHTLIASVLVLYGIEYSEGIVFATIMHTSQFITVLVIGSLSLIWVNFKNKRSKN